MKPAPFRLHRPDRVAEAIELLSVYGDEAKVLAGGQSLMPLLALRLARFEELVDLNRIGELSGISFDGEELVIGAMTRQADVEVAPEVRKSAPLLARALRYVGHFQIRNRGTVGGSLAHADPAAELPAVAMVLGAVVDVVGPRGARQVPAEELFAERWTTVLDVDELLVSVRIPVMPAEAGFAVEEVARRHGDFAMAGVACALSSGHGRVDRARIALFGVGRTPLLCPLVAKEMEGSLLDELHPVALDELAALATADLDPPDDVHATGSYRRAVAAHLVGRALINSLEELRRA